MEKYKKLLANIGIFTLNAVATKLMAFLLMPLYTLYFSTDEYGIMDMAVIMTNMLFPLLTMLISEGMLRYALEDKEHISFYVTESFVVMLLSCVILALLLPLFDLSFFGGLGQYKLWFLLSYMAMGFPTVMSTVARALDQTKLMSYASILSAIVMGVLAYVLIAVMKLGLMGYFYSYIIGNGLSIFVYILLGKQYRYVNFHEWRNGFPLRKQLWKYSIPLAPNTLCDQIQTVGSRLIITGVLGISSSGLYASASKIPNLLNTVQQIIQLAWQLSTFQEFKNKGLKHFYDVIWKVYQALMSLASSAVILFSPVLAMLLMQKQFYDAWPLISVLVVAFYLSSINSFLGTIYQAFMETKPLLTAALLGALICIAFTACFVHSLGITAATFGVLISSFLIFIVRSIDIRRLLRVDMRPLSTAITVMLLTVQSIVTLNQYDHYLFWSSICLLFIAFVQCYELKPLVTLIFTRRKYTA